MYHDLLLAGVPNRFVQKYVLRINKFFEWFLVRRARARVSTSEPMAGELTRQYRRPFHVIRNLHDARIDLPTDSVIGVRARLEPKLPRDALVLIAIGNVKEAHDFSGIAAVAAQSHGRIHLVGIGGNYKTVATTFEDGGAGLQFHDLGRLPARELVPAIRDADAAILPYVPVRKAYEVFLPNGFGQAVAAGLPLLYPENIPAVADLASSNGLGWAINPTQADSIARAIASLQNDASRRLVASNVSRFSQSFNWAQEEKKLLDLIERVFVS
jgi:glycosyltransferase involved in cell wall biosynthesis